MLEVDVLFHWDVTTFQAIKIYKLRVNRPSENFFLLESSSGNINIHMIMVHSLSDSSNRLAMDESYWIRTMRIGMTFHKGSPTGLALPKFICAYL